VLELGTEQRYDISRARDELGYRPRVDFETAMDRTIRWAQESGKTLP
jgi:nucleoside-diphosphate-sugar epimerase